MNKYKKDKLYEFGVLFNALHCQYQERLKDAHISLGFNDVFDSLCSSEGLSSESESLKQMLAFINAVGTLESFRRTVCAMARDIEDVKATVWGEIYERMVKDKLISEELFVAERVKS